MTEPEPNTRESVELELDLLGAAASVVGLVIGAIGPWATALGVVSISGLDSWGDGWIVLGCAIFAAAALYRQWRGLDSSDSLIILGAIGGGVAGYHWHDFTQKGALVSPGWGVILATISGGGLVLCGLALHQRQPSATRRPFWRSLVDPDAGFVACRECGVLNAPASTSCESCGESLPPAAAAAPDRP